MPPKQPKASATRSKTADDSKEDPLQAVIVADTFETKFAPLTLERPRCLLPLANTPLIEYTLQYLASSGVQEVFLYAGAHAEQVEAYINASVWTSPTSPFQKFEILRCVASSVGDLMRDLDQKQRMNGDFVIVSGDVISDFPIGRALRQHKARREKDKNAIMTMLLRESTQDRYQHVNAVVPTFIIDPTKDRCLHYEEGRAEDSFNVHVDPEMLKIPELDIRQDLIDCRIDICTPEVLSLWSDNFDNQTPRKDFLFGVLKDYELNGKTIHTYIIKENYASRVGDLISYEDISVDLKQHLVATSLSVENNVFSKSHYGRSRKGVIRDRDVIVARPTRLETGTIAGEGTSVGVGSHIKNSVIGKRCQIGKETTITSAYIWDDATIGSNVKISRAVICDEAFIGDGCEIGEGALISYGVRVAAGTRVPAGCRLTKAENANLGGKRSTAVVGGSGGEGFEYEDEEEDYFQTKTPGMLYESANFAGSTSTLDSDVSQPASSLPGSRSQSFSAGLDDEDVPDRFQQDTVAILLQRLQEGKHADDMLSELMGLRFGGGADETQVRNAVAVALMKHIQNMIDKGSATAAEASQKTLAAYKTLIRRSGAQQTTGEQVAFLLDIQKDLVHRSEGAKILLFVTKDLYDMNVFEEESFTQWWNDERSSNETGMAKVREASSQFIEWLENAESESEDEEDEDEDDED